MKAILFTLKQNSVLAGILASCRPRWGLGSTACNNSLFWTEFGSKTRYICTLITSTAKITHQHPDTVNYQERLDPSRE